MTIVVTALAVVVGLLAVVVVALLRSHAEILRRLHELGAGVYADDDTGATASVAEPSAASDAPFRTRPGVPEPRPPVDDRVHDLVGRSPGGTAVALAVSGTPGLTLLAFLTSGCSVCQNFWTAFADPDALRDAGFGGRVVVVAKGPEAESAAAIAALAPPGLTTVMSTEAWADYQVPVAPYFLLIDGEDDRVVGEGAASSWPQVAGLLGQALADTGLDRAGRATGRSRRDGRARAADADTALLRAGIGPGHSSLHPAPGDSPVAGAEVEPGASS